MDTYKYFLKSLKPSLLNGFLSAPLKVVNVNNYEIGIDFLNKLLFSARPSSKYCLRIAKWNELTQLLKKKKII